MKLAIYVNFRGTCEEAFRVYEQHLGGRITGIVRHKEQPNPNIPPGWGEKITHANRNSWHGAHGSRHPEQ